MSAGDTREQARRVSRPDSPGFLSGVCLKGSVRSSEPPQPTSTRQHTNVRDNVQSFMSVNGHAFGTRIRHLREGMGLSLRDLSERSGVSAPMLSQVERGETSPTLAVAERIAGGLELTLSQLLRLDETDGVSVVRADERRRGGGPRHGYEVLTPPLPGLRAEVSLHSLKSGASTAEPDDPPMHEAGSRETAVVVDGPLRFVCGGRVHALEAGDSVTFDADLPHHFANPGPEPARFLAVTTAGLRRS
jgi:XRE family transcriptional regulator, regulator of sulfur utilization